MGTPILHEGINKKSFWYLMEKVQKKLTVWKAKSLSLAGRITLEKSVLSAIPIYPMMTTRLPKCVNNEIEKAQRVFVWDHDLNERKTHLIGWKTFCQPKSKGGMGFRSLNLMNEACIFKLGWNLENDNRGLWGEVLRYKYRRGTGWDVELEVKNQDSKLWHDLGTVWRGILGHSS